MQVVFFLEAMDFKANSLLLLLLILIKYTFSPSKAWFYKNQVLLLSMIICENSFLPLYSLSLLLRSASDWQDRKRPHSDPKDAATYAIKSITSFTFCLCLLQSILFWSEDMEHFGTFTINYWHNKKKILLLGTKLWVLLTVELFFFPWCLSYSFTVFLKFY